MIPQLTKNKPRRVVALRLFCFYSLLVQAGISPLQAQNATPPQNHAILHDADSNAYPCSRDPKAREFDFWIGEWDVFNAANNKPPGHSLIQKISGGCAILENYSSTGRPYEGKSINYYEGSIGKWEQVWVGSSGVEDPVKDMQHFVGGEYREGAMRFVFETKVNGQKAAGRFIFYNLGADKVRQYQETSTDGGKTFQVGYDLIYIRKK